ncbi:hypothetical protein TYRP_018098 [Tyrophagus putrescentiae]|nr:hypothetical protein TYRP_018098 [Tyrophagus putrescentiae]
MLSAENGEVVEEEEVVEEVEVVKEVADEGEGELQHLLLLPLPPLSPPGLRLFFFVFDIFTVESPDLLQALKPPRLRVAQIDWQLAVIKVCT